MTTKRVTGKIRNLDEDITNCEKYLSKVLNNKTEKPVRHSDNKNKGASKNVYQPFLSGMPPGQIKNRARSQTRVNSLLRRISPEPSSTKRVRGSPPRILTTNESNQKPVTKCTKRKKDSCGSRSSSCSSNCTKGNRQNVPPDKYKNRTEADFEVKVKTKHEASKNRCDGVSWGRALAESSSLQTSPTRTKNAAYPICSSFSQFDPLRTLHFLTKELQSKIHVALPTETNLHRIIMEIQQSLHRLPPQSRTDLLYEPATELDNIPIARASHSPLVHRSAQTDMLVETPEKSQIKLEMSCTKLEESCKALEEACAQANEERDKTMELLRAEKEKVLFLTTERDLIQMKFEQSTEHTNTHTTKVVHELEKQCQAMSSERDLLLKQLNEYKQQTDLSGQLNALNNQINKLEKEKSDACNKVLLLKLEQEKQTVLLSARDKQLTDLKQELTGIQGLVTTQLSELQKSSRMDRSGLVCSSPASSITPLGASPSFQLISNIYYEKDPNKDIIPIKNSPPEKDINRKSKMELNFSNTPRHKKRYPVMQSPADSKKATPNRLNQRYIDKSVVVGLSPQHGGPQGDRNTIKDIFADIRKQALMNVDVTLPSPPKTYPILENVSSSPNSIWSECDS